MHQTKVAEVAAMAAVFDGHFAGAASMAASADSR